MDVIIVAAGFGSRTGLNIPKQFAIINNKPVLFYSIEPFEKSDRVENIYIVISKESSELYTSLYHEHLTSFTKLRKYIIGGERRQDSVFNALSSMYQTKKTDLVAIHDAARPFLDNSLLEKLIDSALLYGSSAPGIKVTDTVKAIDPNGLIIEHPIRENLRAIQTPQIFDFTSIYNAYKFAYTNNLSVTDDTEIFFKYGGKTVIIEGNTNLFKITYPEDIERAKKILGGN